MNKDLFIIDQPKGLSNPWMYCQECHYVFPLGNTKQQYMDYRITIEWDTQSEISSKKVFPILDALKDGFKQRNYGTSVSRIYVVMTCMDRDLKQRKRFKKTEGLFEFDIILDYSLIKNAETEQKKGIVRKQIVEITEQAFSKYKFDDFDKAAFLADLKEIVNAVAW